MKLIVVPLSLPAMQALDTDTAPPDLLREIALEASEFNALWVGKVFEGIYEECGVFVDDFEDAALVGAPTLGRLVSFLDRRRLDDPAGRSGLEKLRQQAHLAQEKGTGVFFYF